MAIRVWKRRLIVCAAVLLGLTAAGVVHALLIARQPVFAAGFAQRPYYFGRTKDRTPVELTLQDTDQIVRFVIPKVYMTFSPNWQGGPQDVISLQVIYPSMAPVSATRSSADASDVVHIDLLSFTKQGGRYDVARTIQRNLSTEWIRVSQIENHDEKFGVYVYRRDIEKWKTKSIMIDEYLVPRDGANPKVYFQCLREISNPYVGCTAYENFSQNLALDFQFRRGELKNWQNIEHAVIDLLNTFRKKTE